MIDKMIEDSNFENIDYSQKSLEKAEYDNCIFKDCNFSDSDLSDFVFSECTFENCNFSLVNLNNTSLKEVKFINSKLLGVHFSKCNDFLFEVEFDACALNLASFFKVDMKSTLFKNCVLSEADFVETDLSESTFDHCDLQNAIFERTNLQKADFRTSYNYSINPEINKIDNARFALSGIAGLLEKYNIYIE